MGRVAGHPYRRSALPRAEGAASRPRSRPAQSTPGGALAALTYSASGDPAVRGERKRPSSADGWRPPRMRIPANFESHEEVTAASPTMSFA